MKTIAQLIQLANEQLTAVSDSARLDAELLLAHVLGKNRSWLHTWPEQNVDKSCSAEYSRLIDRRRHGEPVAHLLESQAFWTLQLRVTPDTLIPRAETELLVELALARLAENRNCHILDLGTGSGAIALALAKERPACRVLATDQSEQALNIARHNAEQNQVHNIEFLHGNWFDPLAGNACFDLIASNPPYIPTGDPHLAQGDVRFDPQTALVSGPQGLDDLQHIIRHARPYLKENAWLLLEHGYDQSGAVVALMKNAGFKNVVDHHDLAEQPRVVVGQNR